MAQISVQGVPTERQKRQPFHRMEGGYMTQVSFDERTAMVLPDLKLKAAPCGPDRLCFGCAIYENRLFTAPHSACKACGASWLSRKDGRRIIWEEVK